MTHADDPLTLSEMQQLVDDWIGQWDEGYWTPLSNLARLTEEVGELARVLNHVHGDKPTKSDEATGDVALELADVLFVTITIANSLDIDLEAAFRRVLEKYDIRDVDRYTPADEA
jgi:NTP pyrophosphatase (non-canonical NTP hydrolase)